MSRMFETLGYGLMAAAIVCGSVYGLARYAESGALAITPQTAQAVPSTAAPAPRTSYPAPSSAMLPPAVPTENFVRTGNKIYYLASATPAQTDAGAFEALRRNCYEAADSNRNGEYPALQQAACGRFADYARQQGRDTGPLPAYGTPQPQAQEQQAEQQVASEDQGDAGLLVECASSRGEDHLTESAVRASRRESTRRERRDTKERRGAVHCLNR
jgi:hypothetical protein